MRFKGDANINKKEMLKGGIKLVGGLMIGIGVDKIVKKVIPNTETKIVGKVCVGLATMVVCSGMSNAVQHLFSKRVDEAFAVWDYTVNMMDEYFTEMGGNYNGSC